MDFKDNKAIIKEAEKHEKGIPDDASEKTPSAENVQSTKNVVTETTPDPRDYFIDSIPSAPEEPRRSEVAEKNLEEMRKILRGIADEAKKEESKTRV